LEPLFFFSQKTRTEPERLFKFWRTSTGNDTDKFNRFQTLVQVENSELKPEIMLLFTIIYL